MNLKAIKPLYMLLTLTLLISLVPILHVAAPGRPRIFVDPADNTYFSDTTAVGATFNVSVKSADFAAPGVFAHELKVYYDKTMLEATVAAIPVGHWLTPASPANIFVVDPGTINKDQGYASFAVAMLGTEVAKTGGGTIATVTLKIIASPPAGKDLTSKIELKDVILVDGAANEWPSANYDRVPATFKYAAPPPPWYVKIEPSLAVASTLGEKVTINVNFVNVKADAKIVGVQFKVLYPSMLTTASEMVTEGAFFKSFGQTAFAAFVETDEEGNTFVLAFVFLAPGENGVWTSFPEGNGTLATITFNVTSLPATVTTFPLTLTEIVIADSSGNEVASRPAQSGAIQAPLKLEDLNQDGKVDILDITMWALAFGSTPTGSRWNPKADLNGDGKINILDGVRIAKQFGDP